MNLSSSLNDSMVPHQVFNNKIYYFLKTVEYSGYGNISTTHPRRVSTITNYELDKKSITTNNIIN